MSYSKQKPTQYTTTRAINNQLINCCVNCHDLACGCNSPTTHLAVLFAKAINPTALSTEERNEIKQCLGITTEDTTETDVLTGFQDGELERLFSEKDEDTTDG